MKKFKRIIGRLIYFWAKRLPPSFSAVKIGQRQIRAFCGHLILQSCGNNVNIEKMQSLIHLSVSEIIQDWE